MNITPQQLDEGVTLYNYTENHKKYWSIQYKVEEKQLIRTWGRIGNAPQVMEEPYNSRGQALSKAYQLLDEKYAKGYRLEAEMLNFILNEH